MCVNFLTCSFSSSGIYFLTHLNYVNTYDMSVLGKNTEHFHVSKLLSADLVLMSRMYYWNNFLLFTSERNCRIYKKEPWYCTLQSGFSCILLVTGCFFFLLLCPKGLWNTPERSCLGGARGSFCSWWNSWRNLPHTST